jgi:hypothetical protein
VSAIIGGLLTAIFLLAGMSGLEDDGGDVTIKEVAPPQGSSGTMPVAENGTPVVENGPSVREVYTRDGPGVVSVDVAATSDLGPSGGSGSW